MQSLLVVEAASHPKVLENQFFLFRGRFDMTFMTIPDKYDSYQSMMPNILNSGKFFYSIHSTTLFIQLLFIGYRYDYIHISTGPEHFHYSTLWTRPFYFLCTLLYRNKILLTIKNSRSYLNENRYLPHLLNASLKHVKLVMFETDTLRNYFVRAYKKRLRTAVIYDRYTDLLDTNLLNTRTPSPPYRIGMLGALDDTRRDYRTLLEAIEELSQEKLREFELIILGECEGGEDNPILKSLQKFISVDYPERYLSSDEFDLKGSSCDLLMSPLLPSMEYGTFKGTGAFGDAIYLQKNIILPSFVDPEAEFDQIAYYYSNKSELSEILNTISELSNRSIDTKFTEKYSTRNVANDIIKRIVA